MGFEDGSKNWAGGTPEQGAQAQLWGLQIPPPPRERRSLSWAFLSGQDLCLPSRLCSECCLLPRGSNRGDFGSPVAPLKRLSQLVAFLLFSRAADRLTRLSILIYCISLWGGGISPVLCGGGREQKDRPDPSTKPLSPKGWRLKAGGALFRGLLTPPLPLRGSS